MWISVFIEWKVDCKKVGYSPRLDSALSRLVTATRPMRTRVMVIMGVGAYSMVRVMIFPSRSRSR